MVSLYINIQLICGIVLLVLSFLAFDSSMLLATNYYVSTTGSDTATGTISDPFASIQHGSNQLLPGDELLIRGGTYFEKILPDSQVYLST